MTIGPGTNGTARHSGQGPAPRPAAGPSYEALEQTAAIVIRKAAEIQSAGSSAPLANEWQGVFAAARAALAPAVEQSRLIASFGMRILADRAALVRQQDAASRARAQTLAATMVELRASQQAGTATALASLVAGMSGDAMLSPLLPFFVCLEALVRSRLAHDTDAAVGSPAAAYWSIALAEAAAASHPRLVLCAGLSGSGKSFVASGLACELGARTIASDAERKRLAGLEPAEKTPLSISNRVYSGRMTDRVYALLNAEAGTELRLGRSVVLDATYLTPVRRAATLAVAREVAVPAAVVWCTVDDGVAAERLARRAAQGWSISDADARIRRLQRNGLQLPRSAEENVAVLTVNTGLTPAVVFSRLLPRLRRALEAT